MVFTTIYRTNLHRILKLNTFYSPIHPFLLTHYTSDVLSSYTVLTLTILLRQARDHHVRVADGLDLVHIILLDAGVEQLVELVEHVDHLHGGAVGRELGEADDVAEVHGHTVEVLCYNLKVTTVERVVHNSCCYEKKTSVSILRKKTRISNEINEDEHPVLDSLDNLLDI